MQDAFDMDLTYYERYYTQWVARRHTDVGRRLR